MLTKTIAQLLPQALSSPVCLQCLPAVSCVCKLLIKGAAFVRARHAA